MTILEILAILALALLLGGIFSLGFRRSGPWGSFWTFFLVIALTMLAVDAWNEPWGPVYYGIAWLDFLIVGFVIALILAAGSPTPRARNVSTTEVAEEREIGAAVGIFFWFMIICFIALILWGILAVA